MRRSPLLTGCAIALAVLLPLPARATSMVPPSLDEPSTKSDAVVRVTTLATRTEWRQRVIVTIARMRVTDALLGSLAVPTAFAGPFAAPSLDLPRAVIVTALREHPPCHAAEKADGTLLAGFVAVRSGDARGLEIVRRGNEGVLVARLEDAKFYWDTDRKQTPTEQVDKLANVVWKAARRWMAGVASHFATGNSSTGATCWMPALLTRMSTAPNSATAIFIIVSMASPFDMSAPS